MMARLEEFYRKPTMLGGGGKTFDNLTGFPDIGYKVNADGTALTSVTSFANENGTFVMSSMTTTPTITATLAENSAITITYAYNPAPEEGESKITTTSTQPSGD
jgi:hypothetical protein